MALADTVTAQLAAIQSGETAVLTAAITQAFNDGVASVAPGGITPAQEQTDIAAAVQAATDPLNAQLAQVQASLAAMTAEDVADKALVQNFQNSVAALQSSLDAIKAALAAVLPPPPAPAPAS